MKGSEKFVQLPNGSGVLVRVVVITRYNRRGEAKSTDASKAYETVLNAMKADGLKPLEEVQTLTTTNIEQSDIHTRLSAQPATVTRYLYSD
eukprot:753875-Hanusia_phi.AAC.2